MSNVNSPNIKKDSSPQYMPFNPASLANIFQSQQKNLQKSQIVRGSEFTDPNYSRNQNRLMASELFTDNLQQSFDASFYQDLSQVQLQDQYQLVIMENEQMNKQVSQQKSKIDKLQEELKNKNQLIQTMESGDQEQKIEEIQKLKQQIEEQAKTIESLENSIASKESNYKLASEDNLLKIQELTEEIEKKKEIIKQWVENQDESKFKLEFITLNQTNHKLSQQLKKEKAYIDKLKTQLNQKTLKLENSIFTQEFFSQNQEKELILTKKFLKTQIDNLEKFEFYQKNQQLIYRISKTKSETIEELQKKEKQLNQEHNLKLEKLNSKQNDLNLEIQTLGLQKENFLQNEQKCSTRIDNLQKENKKLQAEYEIVKEEWNIVFNSKEENQKIMDEKLNNQVQIKDQEIQNLHEELSESNQLLDGARQQVKQQNEQVENLNENIQNMKNQLSELSENLTEVNQQNELLSQKALEQEKKSGNMIEKINNKSDWLQEMIKDKEKQIQNYKNEIEENKQSFEQMKKLMEENQLLYEKIKKQQNQLDQLQKNDNEQSVIEDNELQLNQLKEEISEKENQLIKFQNFNQNNESEIIDLREKHKLRKNQQIEEREYYEAKIQKSKMQYDEALCGYDKQLINVYDVLEKERIKSNEFQSKLQILENKFADSKEKLEYFQEENKKLNEEKNSLFNKLALCKQKLREITKLNEKVQYESKNAQNQISKDLFKANQQIDNLKEELDTKIFCLSLEKEQNEKNLKVLSELDQSNQELKISLAKEKLDSFQQNQALVTKHSEQLKQTINELNQQIKLSESQIEGLQEQVNNLKYRHKESKLFWRQENQELMKRKEKMEEEILNLKKEQAKLHNFKEEQLQSNKIIDQKQYNEVQKENSQFQEQLRSFKEVEKKNYLESEKDKTKLKSTLRKVEIDLQQQTNDCEGMKRQLEALQKENQEIILKKAQLEAQSKQEQKKNQEMDQELNVKKQEFNQALKQIKQLEAQIENLQNANNLIRKENYNFKCYQQENIDKIEDQIEAIKTNLLVKDQLAKLMKKPTIQASELIELVTNLDTCFESVNKCNNIFSIISKTELPENMKKYKGEIEEENLKAEKEKTKNQGKCYQF